MALQDMLMQYLGGGQNGGMMQDWLRRSIPKGKAKTIGDVAALRDKMNQAIMMDDFDTADALRMQIERLQQEQL